MEYYDSIHSDSISEKDFQDNYKKKMEEMDARMKEPVDTMSTCTICSRELRQERDQSARERSRGRF